MHSLLVENGSQTCVLDDHVRPRINKLAKIILNDKNLIKKHPLEVTNTISKIKETQKNLKQIIVWGIGEYANLLLNNSITFANSKVKFFVDSNYHKQGTKFRNSIVLKPDEVINCNEPILIASSFWYHDIVKNLEEFGVDKRRILSSSLI
jgi:FlaA1/EpsC-like NDP-sugar epimerase